MEYESYSAYLYDFASYIKMYPEAIIIHEKLSKGENLSSSDLEWIKWAVEVSGWDQKDIEDELKNLFEDPISRIDKHKKIFEDYLKEAKEFKEEKKYEQTGRKIWGSTVALHNLYYDKNRIPLVPWDYYHIKNLFMNIKDKQQQEIVLNLFSYTRGLYYTTKHGLINSFDQRFERAVTWIEKFKEVVF